MSALGLAAGTSFTIVKPAARGYSNSDSDSVGRAFVRFVVS